MHEDKAGITGYIQHVSPIKQNAKEFKWFDCELQVQNGTVRTVSFDTSEQAPTKFKEAAKSKSPVKISYLRLEAKDPENY